jgi:hypothetical protein
MGHLASNTLARRTLETWSSHQLTTVDLDRFADDVAGGV